jgi:hypothetical protein
MAILQTQLSKIVFVQSIIHKLFQESGICQGGALNLCQAKPAPKQLNLKSLAMQVGHIIQWLTDAAHGAPKMHHLRGWAQAETDF